MTRRWFVTLMLVSMLLGLGAFVHGAAAAGNAPFKGSDAGSFYSPGSCEGDGVLVVINGTGKATHVGRYAYSANECFHPGTGTFAGTPTLTTPNGDTLTGHYQGQVFASDDPDVITYEEDLTITGGTGRFAGTSEELHVSGVANLATGEYSQTLSEA